tara:strand:- start:413 stop:835 length:423 start_codon:yes stop_codon:yes gene_type:complete
MSTKQEKDELAELWTSLTPEQQAFLGQLSDKTRAATAAKKAVIPAVAAFMTKTNVKKAKKPKKSKKVPRARGVPPTDKYCEDNGICVTKTGVWQCVPCGKQFEGCPAASFIEVHVGGKGHIRAAKKMTAEESAAEAVGSW